MNLRLAYRRAAWWIRIAIFFAGILPLGCLHAAQGSDLRYMVTLSPDASRVAIAKWQGSTKRELFEGALQQSYRKLRMPAGHRADSSILYSPDGKNLLFTTATERPVAKMQVDKSEPANTEPTTLWQQLIDGNGESTPQKIFERDLPITDILPMMDGSLVFMGKVAEVKSHSWSPITGSNRVWSEYKWMLRKPNGTVNVINPRAYAFFSTASLIRDEAVFVVQKRYLNGRLMNPREYYLDVTVLKPGADLSTPERLGNMQDRRGGPLLQCDWDGKTCARRMTFDKDGYYAHRLELIRDGIVCSVRGLPDRLEKMSISRSGNAVALITRQNPNKDSNYKLVVVAIKPDGCAGDKKFMELP